MGPGLVYAGVGVLRRRLCLCLTAQARCFGSESPSILRPSRGTRAAAPAMASPSMAASPAGSSSPVVWQCTGAALLQRRGGVAPSFFWRLEDDTAGQATCLLDNEQLYAQYLAGLAGRPPVPWQTSPTDDTFIENVISLGQIAPSDVVLDIGCGDGSMLLEVVRRSGCCGLGVDISSVLVRQALASAAAQGLQDRCFFLQDDLGRPDWRVPPAASVVYSFFLLDVAETTPSVSAALVSALRSSAAASRSGGLRALVTFNLHPDPQCGLIRPAREALFGVLKLWDASSLVVDDPSRAIETNRILQP